MDPILTLTQSLLYGNSKNLSREYFWLFSQLGLVHLLSASGYHMGVALWFSEKIARALKPLTSIFQKNIYSLLEFCISTSFMYLLASKTGWGKPMVRAFFVSLLWMIGRKGFNLNVNKKWIFLWSILISYFWGQGSTLSCLLSATAISSFFLCDVKKKWQYLLAPWLFTLPITLFYFQYLSLSAPVANLLFSPLISFFCLIPSFIALFFEAIHVTILANFLWTFAASSMKFLLIPMKWLAEFGPSGV